jgi:hypothetical protein
MLEKRLGEVRKLMMSGDSLVVRGVSLKMTSNSSPITRKSASSALPCTLFVLVRHASSGAYADPNGPKHQKPSLHLCLCHHVQRKCDHSRPGMKWNSGQRSDFPQIIATHVRTRLIQHVLGESGFAPFCKHVWHLQNSQHLGPGKPRLGKMC